MIITFGAMFDIRNTIVNLKDKTLTNLFKPNTDNTEEISNKVKSIIKDKTFIHKHLTNAYANFKIYKNNFLEKADEIKEKLENRYVITGIISIIIGYFLGYTLKNIGFYIVLCFGLGIIIVSIINRGKNGK